MKKIFKVVLLVVIVFCLIAADRPMFSKFSGRMIGYPPKTEITAWMGGLAVAKTVSSQCPDYGVCYQISIVGTMRNNQERIIFRSGGVAIGGGTWLPNSSQHYDFYAPSKYPKP